MKGIALLMTRAFTSCEISEWPADHLEHSGHCPVCKSKKRHVLYADAYDKIFYTAPGTWNIYRCEQCGSGYLDPRPDVETIRLAYRDYYTHEARDSDATSLGFWAKLKRMLADGYRNARYGTNYQPALSIGYPLCFLLPAQRALLDRAFRGLERAEPGQKLLDIGCGNGDFLLLARQLGWHAEGVEFDATAIAVARERGLLVHEMGVDRLESLQQRYDLITLSHVLEHVHEPLAVLRQCAKLLKKGGRLWIEVPNMDAWGHDLYRQDWLGVDVPRHLFLFTSGALEKMLADAGFTNYAQLPASNLHLHIFSTSEAVKRATSDSPVLNPVTNIKVRAMAWLARLVVFLAPGKREFLTYMAGNNIEANSPGNSSEQNA